MDLQHYHINDNIPVPGVFMKNPRPYLGVFKTVGILVFFQVVSMVITVVLGIVGLINSSYDSSTLNIETFFMQLISDGYFLSQVMIYSSIICLLVLYLILHFRRGVDFKTYIGFNKTAFQPIGETLLMIIALMVIMSIVNLNAANDRNTEFMMDIVRSNGPIIFIWFGFVIAAPVFEEILFRGFFQTSLANTKLGNHGAVFLVSVVWVLLHSQYNMNVKLYLFVMGLVLGYSRVRYNSIWPAIAGHIFMNLTSMTVTTLSVYNQ